ncbi:MAG TPA: FGGY-family carbohydrate kinase [Actinomycetaceae bacterium]|nr:FGGY-family carbohydrate kinase [Actinomycetaceae bacterium]
MAYFIGVDIGTSSSKGVLVDDGGRLLGQAVRSHDVSHPRTGWAEMDGDLWWSETVGIIRELLAAASGPVAAVGVSGMGPCVLLTDEHAAPLRPAMLYGVDARATAQIAGLTAELGEEAIRARCGSALSTQAVGPKLQWMADVEPGLFAKARRLFMPSSWLAFKLTNSYVLDHQSASQSTPLYDIHARDWYQPWTQRIAPRLELPRLQWASEIAGTVTAEAASATGLTIGTPVITGTIDAWSEAISVDAHNVGDLMLMYGTTMFMVNTVSEPLSHPPLWSTVGALPDTRNLAAGMATSGAVTSWLREIFGRPEYSELLDLAAASGPGARGLLCLPYFAGERTPIADPDARGVIAGLTVSHTRGDLYRAALEATALGVRHNIETFRQAGGQIDRIVAVGGGTQGDLWVQIVSDVADVQQVIPTHTIGASYGAAYLAARSQIDVTIGEWNPPRATATPDPANRANYDDLYALYLELYPATQRISHELARRQREGDAGV